MSQETIGWVLVLAGIALGSVFWSLLVWVNVMERAARLWRGWRFHS